MMNDICPSCNQPYGSGISEIDNRLRASGEMCLECREVFLSIPHIRNTVITMDKAIRVGAEAYLKFTCLHCGSRQTIEKPNSIFTKGKCEECKGTSDFKSPSVNLGILFHAGTPMEVIDSIFQGEE